MVGGILRILQSDWFQERAVFSYLLTTVMVTNCAKRRVKLRIERAKFQFVLIVFCNRAVLLFNFLIKKQWILTKAVTVRANFITQTKRIKRTTLRKLNQASPVFLNSFSYLLKIEFRKPCEFSSTARGLRPRAVLETSGTVFPNTDRPRPVNNVYQETMRPSFSLAYI